MDVTGTEGAPPMLRIIDRPGRVALWTVVVSLIVGLDQLTKQLAEAVVDYEDPVG